MERLFMDRRDAGRQLARALLAYGARNEVIVLALPRGGVPVGYEVAKALGAELDVLIVRKLGVPHHPELAMGAIASGGAVYMNRFVIENSGLSEWQVKAVRTVEEKELARRDKRYRGKRPPPDVRDKTVILVDDGIATGATMHAAVMALRTKKPERIVVAVPVAPNEAVGRFAEDADEFVCLHSPDRFLAVGEFYAVFDQTTDREVHELLMDFHRKRRAVHG